MTYPQRRAGLLRETLLGAVDDLVRDRGWSATTMAAVAAAAGVSRQTVYAEFGNRDALAAAYVEREIGVLLAEVDATVRAHAGVPREALAAAFEAYLRLAADEPLIKTMTGGADAATLLPVLTATGLAVAVPHLAALVRRTWPAVSETDAQDLAETVVRLGLSHAVAPTGPSGLAAATVTRLLGPHVDALLA